MKLSSKAGHFVDPQTESRAKNETEASVAKLISSGILEIGTILELWRGANTGKTAQVMEDGSLRLEDGSVHTTPSGAAQHLVKKNSNGWADWGIAGTVYGWVIYGMTLLIYSVVKQKTTLRSLMKTRMRTRCY